MLKHLIVKDFPDDGYDIKNYYLIRRLLANENSSHLLFEDGRWPINILLFTGTSDNMC
jgi:hypothetical protein